MIISYDGLWSMLRKNKMLKQDFVKAAKITDTAMYKLNHDEPVDLKFIMNICKVFHCNIEQIVEIREDEHTQEIEE